MIDLTREQIEGLEAGPETDEIVCHLIFGWSLKKFYNGGGDWLDGNGVKVCHREGAPRCSTDISWAWMLVEKMGLSIVLSEDGFYAIKPEDVEHGCVKGTDYPTIKLVGREGEEFKPAPTAALAVCRAALLAKLQEQPK